MTPGELLKGLERPWDHEMALLRAGARSLVKVEFADRRSLQDLEDQGWYVRVVEETYGLEASRPDIAVGVGDQVTAFVGTERSVKRALECEQVERHGQGAERREAMGVIGELLGYPSCCTAAYLAQSDQGESASFDRLFKSSNHTGLPAANNLFVLSHQLISHFPCELSCQVSAAVGELGLSVVREERPEYADALERLLTAPITVWDRFRFVIGHPSEGTVTADRLSHEPRLINHPGFQSFYKALPHTPEGGTTLGFQLEDAP